MPTAARKVPPLAAPARAPRIDLAVIEHLGLDPDEVRDLRIEWHPSDPKGQARVTWYGVTRIEGADFQRLVAEAVPR